VKYEPLHKDLDPWFLEVALEPEPRMGPYAQLLGTGGTSPSTSSSDAQVPGTSTYTPSQLQVLRGTDGEVGMSVAHGAAKHFFMLASAPSLPNLYLKFKVSRE
jgi:hypothetical protein